MGSGSSFLILAGLAAIFRVNETPWETLVYLALILVPVLISLLLLIYGQGRYPRPNAGELLCRGWQHPAAALFDWPSAKYPRLSGLPRTLQRYSLEPCAGAGSTISTSALTTRCGLASTIFVCANEELPGLISTLAWYQWTSVIIYFGLLLWTLSRTIPGLNLLIYFK